MSDTSLDAPAKQLTLQQAADMLNVSRAYAHQLVDEGVLPSTVISDRCCIPLDDLLAFKQRRDEDRRAALRELTQLSDELGLYRPTPIPDDPQPNE